jgi:hypothetical protein
MDVQVRKAQREHMVRAAKEKKREAATQKKTTKPAFDKNASKAVKNVCFSRKWRLVMCRAFGTNGSGKLWALCCVGTDDCC